MSFDVNWDPEIYREDHESEEHWELRRAFIVRWKNKYPEDRLICLARVFANMEFMGCRYPAEVMHEVAGLSAEIAQNYRKSRKTKLQRTFVSASTAAEDRARGVKREGGVVLDTTPNKSSKIEFIRPGQVLKDDETQDSDGDEPNVVESTTNHISNEKTSSEVKDADNYLEEMLKLKCLNVRSFKESMFNTAFGKMVLLIRPWAKKLWNIRTSCQTCGVKIETTYENGCFSLFLNNTLIAQATGETKADAKNIVEIMAWNRLREELVSVIVKEQWIAQGDARISPCDVTGRPSQDNFGKPLDSSVASKMMKLMGWKGGGLGAEAQGISEPIKPNLQMVNRAGLGSSTSDIRQIKRAAVDLMKRYIASDTVDLDLVFSSEFSKEERAQLHQCAQRAGLASRSYGTEDRFLVVKKKFNPFSLVRAVIDKGGVTTKYQVFIPATLQRNGR